MVGWLGDSAEGRSRRRWLWGGRWELCSGEPAAQAGQLANVEASGRSRAGARSVHWLGEQVEGKARRRAFNGARRSTARSRESDLPSFYRQPGCTKAVAWAPSRHTVTAWAQHGPGVATCSGVDQVRQRGRWRGGGKVGLPVPWMWNAWRRRIGCGRRCGGLGTSGRSGAPAVVPGRPLAWPGMATRTTSCTGVSRRCTKIE
jgi:hypothetical protein